jgi:hypothetical protein
MDNPLVRHARREAVQVLAIWLATMIYTVSYCSLYGTGRTLDNLTYILGFPDWIFGGVIAPWFVCLAISTWFAFWGMKDDPLGADRDESEVPHDE